MRLHLRAYSPAGLLLTVHQPETIRGHQGSGQALRLVLQYRLQGLYRRDALLKRPDPIQFFDDVILYEDELADNGIAMLSVKVRVMPARLLLLARFFMRLDDVMLRIRDTRVFVEFATGEVIREYTAREEKYETVRKMLAGTREDVLAIMRDPNRLAEVIPVVEKTADRVVLK
jgi:type 2A phosphatase activator TIP41